MARFIALLRRAVCALLLPLAPLPAAAEEAGRPVVLVLDSSGSMAGEMEGAPKLDAARAAVRGMAAEWPAGQPLGLVAYGHRRAGDCADIETLIAPGPLDGAALDGALDGLRAKGKTPLSNALRHAAGLVPEGAGGTVLLVSDGLETCDADPCATAAELRAARPDLVIHVIGFGVTEEEVAALACIAGNGGGRTESADSAGALAEALADLGADAGSGVVVEPAPAPVPEPVPVPVTFAAMLGEGPSPVPVDWTFADAGGAVVYQGAGREVGLTLLPGDYAVTLAAANLRQEARVVVPDAPGAAVPVSLDAGHLALRLWAAKGQALDVAGLVERPEWAVEPLDGQGAVALPGVAEPAVLLAPGRYRVVATAGGHRAEAEVTLAVGEQRALDLSLGLGTLVLAVLPGEGLPPLATGAGLEMEVLGPDGAVVAAVAATAAPRLVIPAGAYLARLRIGGAVVEMPVAVAEGEERAAAFVLPATEVGLSVALAEGGPALTDWRDAMWTVSPGPALAALGVGPALQMQPEAAPRVRLLPGDWVVTVVSGAVSREFALTVAPGGPQEARFALGAARLGMEVDPATQPAPVNAVFSVVPAGGGDPVYSGGTATALSVVVPAGDWRVEVLDEQGRKAAADVTLAPGDETAVRLVLVP